MTAPTPPRLLYTSIRTRVVYGHPVIALKHTVRDKDGNEVKMPWIEMFPEDAAKLVDKLREVLADELLKKSASRPATKS